MDESSFHERADELLNETLEAIELADEEGKLSCDVLDGILTIEIEETGAEYVINKHELSSGIWVSSPESGSLRFSYDETDDEWREKNSELFKEKLSEELANLTGINVDF